MSPLVRDGVLFLVSYGMVVQAIDAATGDLIWERQIGAEARGYSGTSRNLAIFEDKLFLATPDARLVALDARTGAEVWSTRIADPAQGYQQTIGSIVVGGTVVQGLAGCDRFTRDGCFISGYDAGSGRQLWRFNTVARDDEPGGNTWAELSNVLRGGGDTWITGSYDPELNLIYYGVAQPKPWVAASRGMTTRDAALYTNSTVALRPQTGELVWYFQYVSGETLDLDEVYERVLVDVGKRKVVFSAGKHGILWKLDRETGEFLAHKETVFQNVFTRIDPDTGAVTYRPDIIDAKLSEEMSIAAAIGIALSNEEAGGAEDMLKNAATAMRRARALGPGRHEFYDLTMRERARDRLRLETDLRLGVERDEFFVHYQPIVTLQTGVIEGFEALARWQHPSRGLVMPGQFIPPAEETGFIVPMSEKILQRGCAQILAWQERFGHAPGHAPFSLSMNFTSAHFDKIAVLDVVSTALEQSGLDGSCLMAEVTESILLRDVDAVLDILSELKHMRVRVHLDDFGTGYSSLSYLHRLPADTLKIDRSFINRLGTDRQTKILVKAIIDLAHNLGKQVIAEGIETEEQAAIVAQLGCELAQGYYYARPIDAKTIAALLDRCAAASGSPDLPLLLPEPGVAGAP